MARTYPAKRARLTKASDTDSVTFGVDGELVTMTAPYMHCFECEEPIELGERFRGREPFAYHARCADAGEALP